MRAESRQGKIKACAGEGASSSGEGAFVSGGIYLVQSDGALVEMVE